MRSLANPFGGLGLWVLACLAAPLVAVAVLAVLTVATLVVAFVVAIAILAGPWGWWWALLRWLDSPAPRPAERPAYLRVVEDDDDGAGA